MNNKINKQTIIVDDFSHTNTNKIEVIYSNCNEIKDELINKNYNDDFIMTIVNSIFCQLDIDDFLINNDNLKKTMKNTIIAMNKNFFINKNDKNGKIIKQNKNFILAEFSIPLFLKKKFNNKYKWIYCNQSFNYDSNPSKPATGLDCAISYNNKVIYTEIKSSVSKQSYNENLCKAIKSFSSRTKNEEELDSIKSKIILFNRDNANTLDFNHNTFLIGSLIVNHDVQINKNIKIPFNINNHSISILNLKITNKEE